MKTLGLVRPLAFLAFFSVIAASQAAQPTKAPISIVVSASPLTVKVGSEVMLHVVVTNISDQSVFLDPHPGVFKLEVHDANGKALVEIKTLTPVGGSYPSLELQPHEANRFVEIVSKKFDLSKPGKYTLKATELYDSLPVRSNTIAIDLVP